MANTKALSREVLDKRYALRCKKKGVKFVVRLKNGLFFKYGKLISDASKAAHYTHLRNAVHTATRIDGKVIKYVHSQRSIHMPDMQSREPVWPRRHGGARAQASLPQV